MRSNARLLLVHRWAYAVLDEGDRIRNPAAAVSIACKQLHTVHRLILTGAPIQNNLRELWSLVDFVHPGRLGNLAQFEQDFANPISQGGWANASPTQVEVAYRLAVTLRDNVNPFLLRRMKRDVQALLPSKTEQVLFCRLSDTQRSEYERFLRSREVSRDEGVDVVRGLLCVNHCLTCVRGINVCYLFLSLQVGDVLSGDRAPFRAVGILRKICNHPDLLQRTAPPGVRPADYGNWRRSGKMLVCVEVLKLWRRQGHRVLFFTQTR